MTGDGFAAFVAAQGLNKREAGLAFGVDRTTITRWSGMAEVPDYVVLACKGLLYDLLYDQMVRMGEGM